MNETQLFYLMLMVLCLVIYLIVSKICDTMRDIEEAKTVRSMDGRNIKRIDISNKEDFNQVMEQISRAMNKEEDE